YGEELGMEDVVIPESLAQDPARFRAVGRDPERTPMPWDSSAGRGFTTGTPWLPFGDPAINVAAQVGDSGSLLWLYRRLIWLRKRTPALLRGRYRPLDPVPAGVYAYLREAEGERLLVALNFTSESTTVDLPRDLRLERLLLSTWPGVEERPLSGQTLHLAGDEGVLVRLGGWPHAP